MVLSTKIDIRNQAGFSLLEVLITIALLMILTVGGLSASSLTATTIKINQSISNANILAQEAMEAMESVRATNFSALSEGVFHPFFDSNYGWSLILGSESIDGFTRKVTITPVMRTITCTTPICDIVAAGGVSNNDSYYVNVSVGWTETGADKEVALNTLVTRWK